MLYMQDHIASAWGRIMAEGGNSPLDALKQRLVDVTEEAQEIQAAADAEGRDLGDEEQSKVDTLLAEFDRVQADIKRREKIAAQAAKLTAGTGRQAQPETPQAGARDGGAGRMGHIQDEADKRSHNGGFRSLGEMAVSVHQFRMGVRSDPRLQIMAAPTTSGQESVGADGGFLVPEDFRKEIMTKVFEEDTLASMCDEYSTEHNTVNLPKDESSPWDTVAGVQVHWTGEGKQIQQSKPELGEQSTKLDKMTAMVPISEELLEDASMLDGYLRRQTSIRMEFKLSDTILNGTGVGMPQGVMNAPCLKTIAKESGQGADTIVFQNIQKMYYGMHGPCRKNAVWLVHPDVEEQLEMVTFPAQVVGSPTDYAVEGRPVYLPAGSIANSPYGRLKGRPVIPHQACQELGSMGDMALVDLQQYMLLRKNGGLRTATSMHFFFDTDHQAYKFVLRIGGRSWWGKQIADKNGTNTRSCFVTLAERA